MALFVNRVTSECMCVVEYLGFNFQFSKYSLFFFNKNENKFFSKQNNLSEKENILNIKIKYIKDVCRELFHVLLYYMQPY